MIIYVDNSEKQPYDFAGLRPRLQPKEPLQIVTAYLDTGDYATSNQADLSHTAVIERKTLIDLYGTLGQHRGRFQRQFERMALAGYAALVVEANLEDIARPDLYHPGWRSRLHPRAAVATLLAWTMRYRVHLFTCPGRRFAEQVTFRILERWHKDPLTKEKNNAD